MKNSRRTTPNRPESNMPQFARYLGIDYSGAQTPTSSLSGLRVYSATPEQPPVEIQPPPSPRKYWTRRGLAEWLAATLLDGPPTLVGIDHAFSFPLRYFEFHLIPPDWPVFLDDFQHHWPTDGDHNYVDFIRDGLCGHGLERMGNSRWRRLTEERSRSAKSVFHFDVQGSVAKSTHSGLPWLRFLRRQLGDQVHFWPFDGWEPPPGRSVIAEVYPSLWKQTFPSEDRNAHQHDAYTVARWMRETDAAGQMPAAFTARLTPAERTLTRLEGWILGLP
ncbi:MAG: hypothetical protein ABI273_12305 [Lacunisphaera sp.]